MSQRVHHQRVLIYCREYEDCASLYEYFKKGMGDGFTEPPDAPNVAQFRIVDMFQGRSKRSGQSGHGLTNICSIMCGCILFGLGCIHCKYSVSALNHVSNLHVPHN